MTRVITVFGSSRCCPDDGEYELAWRLGLFLGKAGFRVCSGGYGGIMEAVSRGAREAGAPTMAVTCAVYNQRINAYVQKEIERANWPDRMFGLIESGDGYVFLPGGTGTLVELAAAWEMLNKRLMSSKPAVVLGEFWSPVITAIREIEARPGSPWVEAQRPLIHVAKHPEEAVAYLCQQLDP
jgi:uncharacterized protein (TIGR00725 family)